MRKIGELGCREEELKGRKRNAEADLVGKRALLQDNTRRLQEAKSNFAQAEVVLKKAKKKRKKAKRNYESLVRRCCGFGGWWASWSCSW